MNRVLAVFTTSFSVALAAKTNIDSMEQTFLRYAGISFAMATLVWFFGRSTEQVRRNKLSWKDWLESILESIGTGLIAGGFVGIVNWAQPDWDIATVSAFGTFIGTLGPSSKKFVKAIGDKMFGNGK